MGQGSTVGINDTNAAAYLTAAKAHPYEVSSAPLCTPGENEILVKNKFVAINPVDGNLQYFAFFPLKYPFILGQDVCGDVVSVGPNVTRFAAGDRVVGHAVSMITGRNEESGFQKYTILRTNMASHIPANIEYERAVVLPLGLSTAASGLFRSDYLNLQKPTVPAQKPTGETLLVWGGSSSVGCNAIQLAIAAGYEVIATASPRNFEYVKKLGASEVFDYSAATINEDLVKAFEGKTLAGIFDSIGSSAWPICLDVASKISGNKFVATCKRPFPEPPAGVKINAVFGCAIKDNEASKIIYEEFLPKALQAGTFVPAPEPQIASQGLDTIQAAVDLHRAGVSAKKIVVRL